MFRYLFMRCINENQHQHGMTILSNTTTTIIGNPLVIRLPMITMIIVVVMVVAVTNDDDASYDLNDDDV